MIFEVVEEETQLRSWTLVCETYREIPLFTALATREARGSSCIGLVGKENTWTMTNSIH
jgi:hypothetical protein